MCAPVVGEVPAYTIGQHLADDATIGQSAIDPSAGNGRDSRDFQMQERAQKHHGDQAAPAFLSRMVSGMG